MSLSGLRRSRAPLPAVADHHERAPVTEALGSASATARRRRGPARTGPPPRPARRRLRRAPPAGRFRSPPPRRLDPSRTCRHRRVRPGSFDPLSDRPTLAWVADPIRSGSTRSASTGSTWRSRAAARQGAPRRRLWWAVQRRLDGIRSTPRRTDPGWRVVVVQAAAHRRHRRAACVAWSWVPTSGTGGWWGSSGTTAEDARDGFEAGPSVGR